MSSIYLCKKEKKTKSKKEVNELSVRICGSSEGYADFATVRKAEAIFFCRREGVRLHDT